MISDHLIDCIIAVPGFVDMNIKHLFSNTEMLGPKYIEASLLYHGYSVDLFNSYSDGIPTDVIIDNIVHKNPYLVGVTCASQRGYPFVKEFVKDLVTNGFSGKIIIGGFYATIEAEKILLDLPMVDAVNLGEGEFSFPEILHSVIESGIIPDIPGVAFRKKGQIIVNPPVKLKDLDLPFFPKRTPL